MYNVYMKVDDYGQVILTPAEVFESLYSGKISDLSNICISLEDSTEVEKFNNAIKKNSDQIPLASVYSHPGIPMDVFDKENQKNWFMPASYKEDFNIVEFLLDKTENEEQYQRVVTELELFIQHGMYELLIYLKYLVDTMREHNVLWGVGRGSSVASYCLYLLGIHKIDSIKYGLDIREFLK